MAKLRETIGDAVLDVEGDAAGVSDAARQFHLHLAEEALRDVEERLAVLKPLQQRRRRLTTWIAELKAVRAAAQSTEIVDAGSPSSDRVN